MFSLTEHYSRAKKSAHGALAGFSMDALEKHGEETVVAVAAGAGLGLAAAAMGGLDKKVGNYTVPVDAVAAGVSLLAVGFAPGMITSVASHAITGAATARFSQGIFAKSFNKGAAPAAAGDSPYAALGFGAQQDRLVEAAKYL